MEIEWIFAENTGWGENLKDKILSLPKTGLNWHQHSPRYTQSGNLLFFNNNNFQSRPLKKTKEIVESPSYVVEYKIDEINKKATKLWSTENDGEEKVYSIAMGRSVNSKTVETYWPVMVHSSVRNTLMK